MVYLTIYLCFLGYFIIPLLQGPAYRYHTKVLDLCQIVPGFGVLFVNRIVFFLKLELMTFIANMQNKIDFHMLTLYPKATYSFNNFFFWQTFGAILRTVTSSVNIGFIATFQSIYLPLPCPSLCTGQSPQYEVCWKNTAQHQYYRLSFIWGKMSPALQGRALQIALSNCSEELREGASTCKSFAAEGKQSIMSKDCY